MIRVTRAVVLAIALLLPAAAHAQGLFGKNKVVYADREWQVFEEGMVHLYFYPEEEDLARQALAVAVDTYREFAEYFRYSFEDPIPIILYGTHHDFKQTHVIPGFIPEGTAGFTEFAKGRVAIRATGSYAALSHLIRHEMVHAFMLAKLAHVMTEKGIFDYTGPPLWFIEGLAESVARTGPDPEAAMFLRDATLHDGLVPIPELWRIAGTFLMYKEGESIVDFLRAQYADDLPVLFLENWWRGRNLEEVLDAELGLTPAELDTRWRAYLKRRFFPQMLTRRLPEEQGKALLREGGFETASTVLGRNEEGHLQIAFLSARDGTISLYEMTLGEERWPRIRQLVEAGRDARFETMPAFRSHLDAHDGRWIAFVAKNGGQDALYVYDRERGRIVEAHAHDDLRQISSPTFSPDGRRVAFSGLSVDGYSDLFVVDLESGRLRRLTADQYDDVDPHWHPSEERLVFASDRGGYVAGEMALYELEIAEGAVGLPRPLTEGGTRSVSPRWSPDGRSILYVSERSGARNLHVLQGGRELQVSDLTGGVFLPDWIPPAGDDPGGFVGSVYHQRRFSLYRIDAPSGGHPSPVRLELLAGTRSPIPRPPTLTAVARDYRVELGLDFVQSVVALDPDLPYGSGASLGFTDLLGDHQLSIYGASASDEVSLETLNLGVSYTDRSRRWNRHYGLFRLQTQQRLQSIRPERQEERVGGFVGVTYPFSTFDRVEFSTVFRYVDREFSPRLGEAGTSWLWSVFAAYVQDNSQWTWDGPLRGRRFNLTLGQTFDLQGRGFDRQTAQADLRMYQQFRRTSITLAERIVYRRNFGSDTQIFYLGGPNDMRGYDWLEFVGERVWFGSTELRLPLVDRLALRFPFGRFDFPSIRGAIFNDIGNVDGGIIPTDGWVGSFGYSFYMVLLPPLALRLDIVRAHDFDEIEPWNQILRLSFLY